MTTSIENDTEGEINGSRVEQWICCDHGEENCTSYPNLHSRDTDESNQRFSHNSDPSSPSSPSIMTEQDIQQFAQTNPMMQRVQEALRTQLKRARDRVKADLYDQEEHARKVRKEREELGVTLYNTQQQLARLQSNVKTMEEEHETVLQKRQDDEKLLIQEKEALQRHTAESEELNCRISSNQAELLQLQATLKQMKKYNDNIKSEIAVTRRVAHKTEKDTRELEHGKNKQDLYILDLQEQIRGFEEEIALATQQLHVQHTQSLAVKQMIQETMAELDALGAEKKQLLQQWKSSVVALQLRDEALVAATSALRKIRDETKDNQAELEHLHRQMVKLEQKKDEINATKIRLDNESKYLDESMRSIQEERENMAERYALIQKLLSSANDEDAKMSVQLNKIKSETAAMERKIELVDRERVKLEHQIETNKYEQTTVSMTARHMEKQEKGILTKLHQHEMEVASARNELARLNIEKINAESHISQLQETLTVNLSELKDRDAIVVKFETEIRRNNDEIDKKMTIVDRLNRKYQKMLEGVEEEEPLGPLEATIKSLNKEIDIQEEEASRMQRELVTNETSLMQTVTELEAIQERNTELEAKLNILNHKRLRLAQDIHTNDVETKSLKSSIQGIHVDMSRLNDLISRNTKLQSELLNEASIKEKMYGRELKRLEQEKINLDVKVAETKAAKNKLLGEIVEAERQVLIWEKNIQLEKETQASLKSSRDASDIRGMEKEIHRMRHRLEQLNREQEFMVRDMERAVYRREDIALKYSKSDQRKGISSSSSSKVLSNGELERLIKSYKEELKTITRESNECVKHAQETRMETDKIRQGLETIGKGRVVVDAQNVALE